MNSVDRSRKACKKTLFLLCFMPVIAAAALAAAYLGHTVSAYYGDTRVSGSIQVPHSADIDCDAVHDWQDTHYWRKKAKATEDDSHNDMLTISAEFQHLEGPHDEGVNPTTLVATYIVNADNLAADATTALPMILLDASHPPTDHPDELLAILAVQTESGSFGSDQIIGYTFRSWATHKSPKQFHCLSGALDRAQKIDDHASRAFGSGAVCVDPATGETDLFVLVSGLSATDLISAFLRKGAPGSEGPVILDLGPPSSWQDLEGTSVSREIEGVFVPASFLPDILAGRSYVELRTVNFPAGEIRGQLTANPLPVQPQSFAIRRGRLIHGDLQDVLDGDDRHLVVQARSNLPWVAPAAKVDFEATAPGDQPLLLKFRLQANTGGIDGLVVQKIRLFDFDAGKWEQVDERPAKATDSVAEVRVARNAGRFVEDGSCRMLARVSWLAPVNPVPLLQVNIDQVAWEVTN